jgi:hypothetical protein
MSSSVPTCAFKGCSALRLHVAGTCSACRQEFCGRHRLAEQHECASVATTKAANARSWVLKSSDTGVKVDLVVGTLTPAGGFRWFMHAHADCTSGKNIFVLPLVLVTVLFLLSRRLPRCDWEIPLCHAHTSPLSRAVLAACSGGFIQKLAASL